MGAAYVGLLVREFRHLRHHPHHREAVAWLELAAAGILALEGYHIWHRHHAAEAVMGQYRFHLLPWLYGAVALLYVGLAFGMRRLDARRHLHLHPHGFELRLHPLAPLRRWRWSDVAAVVAVGPHDVRIRRPDGREDHVSFARMHAGEAARERLLAHVAAAPGGADEAEATRPA